ncbi:MAG: hypothetical protein NC918_00845 [Candidatus Omnitrophica bacterium]|nr:hypothetical protein [Candidatus Omnitrophota bacterium]
MIPESELISKEYVVRDMQFLGEVKLTKKGLIRYICLSLGLIQPNESRTLVFDILEVLIFAHFKEEELTAKDIIERINKIRLNKPPAKLKAVMYHLKQLKNKGLITSKEGKYIFVIPPLAETKELGLILEHIYLSNIKIAFEKIKKALDILKTMDN